MQVNGFSLIRDNAEVDHWVAIPARIEIPGLRVDGATAGWSNGEFSVIAATWTEPDPPPIVPQIISDRQFFQQLAVQGVITQDEALAAVGPGTLPAALVTLVAALPAEQQFPANMLLKGAVQFDRQHPMVAVLGAAFRWSGQQIDDLWRAASLL